MNRTRHPFRGIRGWGIRLGLCLFVLVGWPAAAKAATDIVHASLTIAVEDREETAATLVAAVQERGGYFASLDLEQVTLKVPQAHLESLRDTAEQLGVVVERSLSRQDRSMELAGLQARLDTREEMLDQYMTVLEGASADSVVTVEREVTSLVEQIENLRGQIRVLEHQVTYATLVVRFRFQDRSAPVPDGSSSFAWLNTLNLSELLEDFRFLRRWGWIRGPLPEPPRTFAPYRSPGGYHAVNPDGVLFRVRRARHRPRADLAFWKEAMKKRMLDAGYRFHDEGDVTAGGVEGTWLELTAPLGVDDYTYLVAVFPKRCRLVIVEAAGPVEDYQPVRDDILETLETMTP